MPPVAVLAVRAVSAGVRCPVPEELRHRPAPEAWIGRDASTGAHASRTVRTRPDDEPMAVADQYGRVYGVAGCASPARR
ncbi:MAG TPA: hypothetical protein VNM91_10225 [Dehalococcoidia bacterium]|nr:hypothetical protein [Dehalococcoidia bacterium]